MAVSCSSNLVTKGLYDIYRDEPIRIIDSAWIWRLKTCPRVRLFIWKIAWSQLPIRALHRARGVSILANYPSYGFVEETMEHVFFWCLRVVQA